MTTNRSKAKPLLAILVFLALLSSTWPAAQATHVNDSVAVPMPSGLVPATGIGAVDNAAKSVTGPADEAAERVNEALAEAPREPEIPATYFRDALDLLGKDHLGGWGMWVTGDSATPTQGAGWQRTSLPGSERQGFAFGNEEGYAIRNDRTLNSFLVSPRISLDALPIDSPTGSDARAPQQAMVGPVNSGLALSLDVHSSATAIRLYIDHRFHFACQDGAHSHPGAGVVTPIPIANPVSSIRGPPHQASHPMCDGTEGIITGNKITQNTTYQQGTGMDGGRVLVFRNAPPSMDDLVNPFARGMALMPLSEPLPAAGFTGSRDNFYRSAFNLTNLAGQDVWLVFHAAITPQGSPSQHFQRENRFDLELPFYGWQLDNILLEGPAYPHNIKVDAIAHPHRVVDGQLVLAPGLDQDPLAMVVMNRGQFTANIRPSLNLTSDVGLSKEYVLAPMTLKPGETRLARFNESRSFIEEGMSYTAIFEAELIGQRDAYLADNVATVSFVAKRSPGVLMAIPLAVSPRTGDAAAERQATVTIGNSGNGRETLEVNFALEYQDPSDGTFSDVTADTVLGKSPASVSETFVLEPGQSRAFEWALNLETPGKYRVLLDGVLQAPDGPITFSTIAEAATLLSQGTVYRTDFTSPGGWTSQFSGDTKPPCAYEPDPCLYVWEMPSVCSTACKTLIGFVDTDHLDVDPDTPIASLRIDITQWFDAPCRTGVNQRTDCRLTPGFPNHLPAPHTTELWFRSPMEGGIQRRDIFIGPQSTLDTIIGQLTLYDRPSQPNIALQDFQFGYSSTVSSHAANRLMEYSQWVDESHTVPVAEFADRLQNQEWAGHVPATIDGGAPATAPMETMPLRSFDEWLNLRFVGGQGSDCQFGPGDDWVCPSWRISKAKITAITAETTTTPSQELVLAEWNGREETVGSWGIGNEHERTVDSQVHELEPALDAANEVDPAVAEEANKVRKDTFVKHPPGTSAEGCYGPNIHSAFNDRWAIMCPTSTADFGQKTQWRKREVATLGDGASNDYNRYDSSSGWQRVPSYGGRSGVWTNADGPKDAAGVPIDDKTWAHSNLQSSLLQSPPLAVPADAASPKIEFDHRFNFLRSTPTGWITDHGGFWVRFLGADGEATTPYMQVALRYQPEEPFDPTTVAAGLPSTVHRFYDNECTYYALTDCDPRDPSRDPVTHALSLDRLPILDYSRVNAPLPAEPDLQALLLVDLRDGHIVWQQEGGEEESPRMCDGACTVQFAFRTQTGMHSPIRYSDNAPVGWFIDRFELLADEAQGHDIAVTDISLQTTYDWENQGLGPGDEAILMLELENRGLFEQPIPEGSISIDVTLQRVNSDDTVTDIPFPVFEVPSSVVLPGILSPAPDAERQASVRIPLAIPEAVGSYRLLAKVHLNGELRPDQPGLLPISDEAPANNCAGVILNAAGNAAPSLGECDISILAPLPVHPTPQLEIELDVNPIAGRAGEAFPREVPIMIRNTGNVQVQDFQVVRFVTDEEKETQIRTWTLPMSPPVGGNASLLELLLETADYEPREDDYWVPLLKESRYEIGARIVGFETEDVLIVDSFESFYADAFRTSPDYGAGQVASDATQPENETGPWQSILGTGPSGNSRGWHFGDPQRQTYPDATDEALLLPALDLSSVARGSFAIMHKYDFEEGYDGGRVEASLDNGTTWHPLIPQRGYVSLQGGHNTSVYPGNPMNPDQDPLTLTPAWTGSSGGWTIDEFHLGQVEELVSETLLYEFSQAGFSRNPSTMVTRAAPGDDSTFDRASFSTTWAHPATATCSGADPMLEKCWYREDVHMGSPAGNPAGDSDHNGAYWWSGPRGPAPAVTLPLFITLPPAGTEYPLLSFWRWEDDQASNAFAVWIDRDADGDLDRIDTTDVRYSEDVGSRTPDGWRRFTLNLAGFQDAAEPVKVPVEFRFDYNQLGGSARFWGRGGVVDSVQLLSVHRGTDEVVTSRLYNTHDPAWGSGWQQVAAVPSPGPVWNPRDDIAGRTGATTAFLFGDLHPTSGGEGKPLNYYNYPDDAHERLVSPVIDLGAVGGMKARASFWEAFNFQPNDLDVFRQVMVQPFVPTLEGEVPGPWVTVPMEPNPGARISSMTDLDCVGERPPAWCQRSVDLSAFIGQRIRLGFDVRTDSHEAAAYCHGQALNPTPSRFGCYWAVDDLKVFADTVAGQPLLVRLRAASDSTVGDGGWTIDNVQLVGRAYKDNVLVKPDQTLTERRIAPGDSFTLTGQIRNLGPISTSSLALQAQMTIIPPAGVPNPPQPTVEFGTTGGSLMEFTLLGAGAMNDRTDYEIHVQVPDGAHPGTRYRIDVDVVQLTGAGVINAFADDNTGDHRRAFTYVVEKEERLAASTKGAISPLTAAAGEPIHVSVEFASTGTIPAGVENLVFTVTNARTGEVVATSPVLDSSTEAEGLLIAPGSKRAIDWTWPATDAQGFYRVDAAYRHNYNPEGTMLDLPVGVVLVGQKPIYYQETFDVNALTDAGWFSSQTCGSIRDCWRLREDISYVGDKSVYIGPDDLASGTHRPRQDVRLEGQTVDLTALALLNELDFRDSPFNPSLTFRYHANLGDNDGVIVEAIRPNQEGGDTHRYLDSADYSGQLVRGSAQTGNAMMSSLPANHNPVDAFTDRRLDTWRPVSVPLGPETGSSNGVSLLNEHALVGHDVSFAFRFGSSLDGDRGQAFTVDAVTVSSYASSVQPAETSATLTTGADKIFHFLVENRGPAKDTFTISLAPESALTVFDVDILTPTITLEAGESALAKVRVAAPSFELGGGAGGFLLLEVASLGDPNSVTTAALTLTYLSTALPDLAVKLDRPDGGGTTIHVDTPTSFLATVTNVAGKRESRPTSLEVGVCPWNTGDPEIDLITCRAQGKWTVLATRSLGVLQPGESQAEPVTWIPKESMTGRVHIIAQADPMGLLREPTRDNNIHSRTMDVLVVDRPHLRVVPGSLKVMHEQEEAHKAIEGDLLQITGTIENSGTADAQGTLVRLVNQFPLLSKHMDRLAPGEQVTFSTQWRAETGNWIILLEIIPGLGSMQDGDEGLSARWDLAVERGHVGLAIEPTELRLEPGRSQDAFIRVINDRAATTFVARLHGQDDVLLTGLPARFNLTAGQVQEYAVEVAASPFAQAGPRTIRIDLHTDPLLPPVAHTEIEVTVGRAEPLTFQAGRVTTGPGTVRVLVDVTNHGTTASPIQIQPQAPTGWDVAPPAPVTVEPGATRSIEILVTVPPGTAPGNYAVEIHMEGVQRAAAIVEVLPAPAWQSKIEYTTLAEDGTTLVWVRLENIGNAPGLPLLDVLGQDHGASVEPPLHILEPGQVQVFRVQLAPGGSIILPGQQEPTELPPPGDGTQVQVMRWQLLPRGTLQAGDTGRVKVELLNPSSSTHAEYPLVLYVNGFPAAEAAVSLDAGGSATVELPWTARAGEHAVSVTHGDLEETTINEFVNVESRDNQAPGLSPLFILLLVAALTLVGRRRRQ